MGPPSLGFLMDCSFLCLPPQVDKGDFLALNLAGGPGHGDADGPISLDVPDGAPDPQRTKAAIEHLHQKIQYFFNSISMVEIELIEFSRYLLGRYCPSFAHSSLKAQAPLQPLALARTRTTEIL